MWAGPVPLPRKALPRDLGHTALLMHNLDLWPNELLKKAFLLHLELNVSVTVDLVDGSIMPHNKLSPK